MKPAEFVDALYCALLGRAAEPSGLAFWTDLIQSTGDATLVMRGILESEEYASAAALMATSLVSYQGAPKLLAPPSSRPAAERI